MSRRGSSKGLWAGRSIALTTIVLVACGSPETPENAPLAPEAPASETPSGPPPAPPSTSPAAPTPAPVPEPELTAKECFKNLAGTVPGPDYDKFKPTLAKSCAGTHHQNITGVQKVVFLGDSVTVGTPPTLPNDFYRLRLEGPLKKKFGSSVEFASCAKWGARTDDLLEGGNQIGQCFPSGVENKKTLIIMTNGGNDIHAWAKDKLTTEQALAQADDAIKKLRTAIEWLTSKTHFPNGSYVTFSNVYEYTDTSGDLSSCPTAQLAGMDGAWPQGKAAVVHFEEEFMHVAVDTKTDMMFLLEHFCGHGYKRKDTKLQCYRGPSAELWFDATCIHPTPEGHEQIANQFAKVIEGT
jgi:lysophospholipase L1-like esterase